MLIVPDATADRRFADNPLVVGDPHIRFYAGAPILSADGFALGSIAAIDYVPRSLDDDQIAALRGLSHQATAQLELRRRLADEKRGGLERLRQSEQRYRELIEELPDALLTLSPLGAITSANRATETLLRCSRDALAGRSFHSLVHEDDRDRAFESFSRALRGEKPPEIEVRLTTADNAAAITALVVTPQTSAERVTAVIAVARDVSERKRVEEQLRQSQKMEVLGQLSGGVAHDFNNLLTVIHAHATVLRDGNHPARVRTMASEIIEAGDRGTALTRQLLLLSRQQATSRTTVDVNDVVRNLLRMLSRIVGTDIRLTAEYAPSLPSVEADVGMLEQIVLNLVVNARDAVSPGGQVTIATSAGVDDRSGAAAPCVCLTVSDNGVGIPAAVLPHIFEPFFTTKPVGKGTGLGLATVKRIVEEHDGWVDVESTAGKGTTFRVCLRARDAAPRKLPAL